MAATVVATSGNTIINLTPEMKEAIALATTAGLNPHFQPAYRGTITLIFNAAGWEGTFGGAEFGVKSGKFLRGSLKYGNEGDSEKFATMSALLTRLRELPQG